MREKPSHFRFEYTGEVAGKGPELRKYRSATARQALGCAVTRGRQAALLGQSVGPAGFPTKGPCRKKQFADDLRRCWESWPHWSCNPRVPAHILASHLEVLQRNIIQDACVPEAFSCWESSQA